MQLNHLFMYPIIIHFSSIKVFPSFLSVSDFGLGTGATDINLTNTIVNVGRNWVDKSRCPGRMAFRGSWLRAGGQGPLAEDTPLFFQNSVGTKPGMDRELCNRGWNGRLCSAFIDKRALKFRAFGFSLTSTAFH